MAWHLMSTSYLWGWSCGNESPWAKGYLQMPEIAAFPHLSLSAAQTLATQRCGFLRLEAPAFLCLPADLAVYRMRHFLPPGSCPRSSAHAQLPACNTRNSLKKLVSISATSTHGCKAHSLVPQQHRHCSSCPQEEAADAAQWNEIWSPPPPAPGVNDGEHCWTNTTPSKVYGHLPSLSVLSDLWRHELVSEDSIFCGSVGLPSDSVASLADQRWWQKWPSVTPSLRRRRILREGAGPFVFKEPVLELQQAGSFKTDLCSCECSQKIPGSAKTVS